MVIDPAEIGPSAAYKLLTGLVVPRPIAFVSTLSPDGVPNLAPFSFFNGVCGDPPVVCFAPSFRVPPKDTLVPGTKRLPVMVTPVPPPSGPAEGDTPVTAGEPKANSSPCTTGEAPAGSETTTSATPLPAGTVAVREVLDPICTEVAGAPPTLTAAPGTKPVPVTVIVEPLCPASGETALTDGGP